MAFPPMLIQPHGTARKRSIGRSIWRLLALAGLALLILPAGGATPARPPALQFKRGDLEQSVVAALEESGIKPSLLELELTESIMISNIESVLATVKRLKALGVTLSIDDFGTGYSSLSYLKRFAVDRLKIDQSFVRDLASNAEDAAIVHAIIRMAHSLGLTTIAEGVEDAAALARLRVFGCDLAQGYFFSCPMPAEELMSYLDKTALVLA